MLSREEIKVIYEQGLDAVIALVEELVATFQQQVEQLRAQVKELQDRLALTSRNGSKPPSSKPPAQRTNLTRSQRQKARRPARASRQNAQSSPTPNRLVVHEPLPATTVARACVR